MSACVYRLLQVSII